MEGKIVTKLDLFDMALIEQRRQAVLKDTIKLFNHEKKVETRNGSIKNIDEEDNRLIKRFVLWNDLTALNQLIDYYTPFIKSMVWKPFKSVKGKSAKRLYPLQVQANSLRIDRYGYKYISSWAEEIVAEALMVFFQLVLEYCPDKGTFSGFIKNYLPLRLESIYRQIIKNFDYLYIDGLPEEIKEEIVLKYLSCTNPEEEDILDLEKYEFTDKQKGVAILVSEGLNDTQIAKILGITRQGVIKHKSAIRNKIYKYLKESS